MSKVIFDILVQMIFDFRYFLINTILFTFSFQFLESVQYCLQFFYFFHVIYLPISVHILVFIITVAIFTYFWITVIVQFYTMSTYISFNKLLSYHLCVDHHVQKLCLPQNSNRLLFILALFSIFSARLRALLFLALNKQFNVFNFNFLTIE